MLGRTVQPDSCGWRPTKNNGLILGEKNKISGTAVCDADLEESGCNVRELPPPPPSCIPTPGVVQTSSTTDPDQQFASASGAHLQNVFTSSESGTVFTGAGTRFAAACAVTFCFFFNPSPSFCTGIWLRPVLFHACAPAPLSTS